MISVAMTTYNGEKYIEKQLMSILNQTLAPDEIVICDDCSEDGTPAIVKRIADGQPHIRFIRNERNLGYRKNFKKAIGLTKGDYIFLSDQDDEWHEDKIEKMAALMKEKGCAALCSDYQLIDENSSPLDKESYRIHPFIKKAPEEKLSPIRFENLIYGNILQGCTCCFTKAVKESYLKIDNADVDHDQQMMFVASLLGEVFFFKNALIDYRIHSENAIGISEKGESERILIKKPSKIPFMATFLDELDAMIPVKHKSFYNLLFYLRIPYFVSKLRKY